MKVHFRYRGLLYSFFSCELHLLFGLASHIGKSMASSTSIWHVDCFDDDRPGPFARQWGDDLDIYEEQGAADRLKNHRFIKSIVTSSEQERDVFQDEERDVFQE